MVFILHFSQVYYQGGANMKKERKKLLIQPIYSIAVYYFLGICFLILLFLPKLFLWKQSDLLVTSLCYFCLLVFSITCFCIGTLHIQFGIIHDNKIVIRDLFHIIAVIKREKILSIKTEKIITYYSRGVISLKWLVLRTDEMQNVYKARNNKKGAFPILIIANKRNIYLMNKFMGTN